MTAERRAGRSATRAPSPPNNSSSAPPNASRARQASATTSKRSTRELAELQRDLGPDHGSLGVVFHVEVDDVDDEHVVLLARVPHVLYQDVEHALLVAEHHRKLLHQACAVPATGGCAVSGSSRGRCLPCAACHLARAQQSNPGHDL